MENLEAGITLDEFLDNFPTVSDQPSSSSSTGRQRCVAVGQLAVVSFGLQLLGRHALLGHAHVSGLDGAVEGLLLGANRLA